jgi:L-2-hydroxyglutarate oxidase LhgO
MEDGVYYKKPVKVKAYRYKEGDEDGLTTLFNFPPKEVAEKVPFIRSKNKGSINIDVNDTIIVDYGDYREIYTEKEFKEIFVGTDEILNLIKE